MSDNGKSDIITAVEDWHDNEMIMADVLKTKSGRVIVDPETNMPIMLAVRAPGQVAAQPDPSGIAIARGAASGNPLADPATGRFASGGGGTKTKFTGNPKLWSKLTPEAQAYVQAQIKVYSPDQIYLSASGNEVNVVLRVNGAPVASFTVPTTSSDDSVKQSIAAPPTEPQAVTTNRSGIPPGVDPEVWNRRLDMVRAAARENDSMDAGDAKQFLKAHVNDISQVDIDAFLRDVRAHRLDDLVDILDQQTRPKVVGMQISRRMVKVSAPKGFARRVFNGLNDEEVISVVKRLEGRGYDPEDLTKFVISGISSEERRTKLEQLYGESKPKSGKKAKK